MAKWFAEHGLPEVPPDAAWIVEQEAYYEVTDGRISSMIILCDGYHRPTEGVSP
jgi:hypothetical protein